MEEYVTTGLSTLSFKPIPDATVDEYFHQTQVIIKVRGSDYIFNTFRVFFNLIWGAVTEGRFVSRLEKAGVNVNEWEKGPDKWNGRRAFVLVNRRRGIVFYCRSLQRDMPVMFSFMDVGFSTGDMAPLGEKNTVTISKMWDAKEKTVLISLNFVGHPRRYLEFLEKIKTIAHRPVDWKRELESGRAKVHPIRSELYVRYDERYEQDVKQAIKALYRRYGVWIQIRENHHEDTKKDIVYNGRAEIIVDGLRLHIKTYRRQKYNHPPKTPDDHPKIEISIYFKDNTTLDEVEEPLNKAGSLLASLVYAINIQDKLIKGWDTYPTVQFEPDPLFVRGIIKGKLEEMLRQAVFPVFKLNTSEKEILLQLSHSNLTSKDLTELAKKLGVTPQAVTYHMRKLKKKGLVISEKVSKTQWIYMLNIDAFRGNQAKKKRDIQEILAEAQKKGTPIPQTITNKRLKTVYLLICGGYTTIGALSRVLNVSERRIRQYLFELEKMNLIKREKVGRYVRLRPKYPK